MDIRQAMTNAPQHANSGRAGDPATLDYDRAAFPRHLGNHASL